MANVVYPYAFVNVPRDVEIDDEAHWGIERTASIVGSTGVRLRSYEEAMPAGIYVQPTYLGTRRVRIKLGDRWATVILGAGVFVKLDDASWTEVGEFK